MLYDIKSVVKAHLGVNTDFQNNNLESKYIQGKNIDGLTPFLSNITEPFHNCCLGAICSFLTVRN